jgi:hypothetical protein
MGLLTLKAFFKVLNETQKEERHPWWFAFGVQEEMIERWKNTDRVTKLCF